MSHNVFSEVAFLFLAWYQGVEVAFSCLLGHIYLLCKSALADENVFTELILSLKTGIWLQHPHEEKLQAQNLETSSPKRVLMWTKMLCSFRLEQVRSFRE